MGRGEMRTSTRHSILFPANSAPIALAMGMRRAWDLTHGGHSGGDHTANSERKTKRRRRNGDRQQIAKRGRNNGRDLNGFKGNKGP